MKGSLPNNWIRIDPANPAHRSQVLGVYRACEDFLALGPQPHASLEMVRADLAYSQEHGGEYYGISLPLQNFCAVLDFIPEAYNGKAGWAYLSLLMIAHEQRRMGLGNRLLDTLEGQLRGNGIATLFAHVQINNPAAIAFFLARGFNIISAPAQQPDGTTSVGVRKTLT